MTATAYLRSAYVLLPLLTVLWLGGCPAPRAQPTADADTRPPAPDLQLATLEGGDLHLADSRGQWVLLNFWATWCGGCRDGMP